MNNDEKDEINQMIQKILSEVNPSEKAPIILSSQDIDMIIDSTYYSLKMNLNTYNNFQNFSSSDLQNININASSLLSNINDNDINISNYIKQAEKYISAINKKTLDTLKKEEKLNINDLISQIPSELNKPNNNTKSNALFQNRASINNIKEIDNKTSPFEFVSNYEIDNYTNNTNILKPKKYFILSEYHDKNKIRYNPMKYIVNQKIFQQIYKRSYQITCIATKNNIFYIGNNLGTIKSIQKEHEYKTYESEDLKNLNDINKSVTCLAFSPDNDTFVSGHENGAIIMWETYSTKIKKFIDPGKNNKVRIIAIKYLIKENGSYTIIVSNADGKIVLITIIEGYVMTSVCVQHFINKLCPCYLIETLNFDYEEKRVYNNINLDNNGNYIALIGNEETIEVFLLSVDSSVISSFTTGNKEFKIQNVLTFRNPIGSLMQQKDKFLNYPCACFGYGYILKEKKIKNKIKNILDEEDYDTTKETNKDKTEGDIILSLSWHNTIYIYSIPIINNQIQKPKYEGYYKDNSSNIIHIGFFSSSIVYYIDENRKIKLLNTNYIKQEKEKTSEDNNINNSISLNNSNEINTSNYLNIDTNKSKEISNEELVNIKDKDMNTYKEITIKDFNLMYNLNPEGNIKIYKNYICSSPKNIYILSRNSFNHIQLFSWEKCLDNMKLDFDWITLFCVGIDIYKGKSNIRTLDDISNDAYIRKTRTKYVLKKFLKEYFTINLNENLNVNSNFDFVNITIETCINIEELDYLLHDIYNIINMKGFGDLFLEKFEPFILKDKIKYQVLSSSTLQSLIEFYVNKNKIYNLSQAILHLNIKCLKYKLIKNIALQYNFFSVIIFIYTNASNDYFYPLLLMYKKFSSYLNDNNNNSEKQFMEIINDSNNKIENKYETFENTKEYLGYKIFWYINICIKGQKYPSFNELIDENTYYDIIIVFFIFYTNALNLRIFDSYTYFLILENFFSDKNVLFIIKNINEKIINDVQTRKNIQLFTNNENTNINLETIINGIYKTQNKNNIFFDKFDLSYFIIKICTKIEIKENILYDSIFFLLNYYKSVSSDYHSLKQKDTFELHSKILDFDNDFFKQFNNHIISSINVLRNNYTDYTVFKSRYINNLISLVEESPFIMIKIYIHNLNDDYKKCVDLYLESNSLSYEEKLRVFKYIHNKLEELKSNPYYYSANSNPEINYFKDFKNYISTKIEKLATISIEELERLILTWFNKEQISIINKLDIVPEIQLQYLYFFTKEIINNYNNENGNNNTGDISQEMKDIFLLYFKLLIKMGKSNYLISVLKEGTFFYPLDKCLELTIENGLNEPSIYIYEILGKYNEALSIAINEIDKIYIKAKNIIINKDDFELEIDTRANLKDIKEDLLYKLQRNINVAIKICQKVSGKELINSIGNVYIQLWYNLFIKLFEIYEDIKSSKENNTIEKISLLLLLSNEFEIFLKNAFAYQGTEKIIYYMINICQNKSQYIDFISILSKILPLLKNYSSLLKTGNKLFNQFYMNDLNIFSNKTFEGVAMNLSRCDICHKIIDKNTKKKIVLFQCGHILHFGCSFIYEEMPYCSICYDNKYEYQITFPKNIKSEKVNDEPNKEKLEAQKNRKKMHLMAKLDILDNNYFEENI